MAAVLVEERPIGATEHGSLTVEGLSHRIGGRLIVDDVDLKISAGEVHCLVGPSGCGKSTTLRLISGLEVLQEGTISVCGRKIADPNRQLAPENRRIGLMFQDFALFPHMTVRKNIGFGLSGKSRAERSASVEAWLSRIELASRGDHYPHELSGGEQQRVALARALAPSPCLMLLDEAFSSLDAHLREDLRTLVMTLLRETGTPTLLVTHDADEAVRVADRLHVMRDGRILQSGTAAEVYGNPVDLFVCNFFGATSRFKGWAVGGKVSTPLCDIVRPDLPDGTAVDVVVRPEAVNVLLEPGSAERAPIQATVVGLKELGPRNVVSLALPGGWVIGAWLQAGTSLNLGTVVGVSVNPLHIFVFDQA